MRTLRIHPLNNIHKKCIIVLISFIMLYLTSLVLIYLTTWSLYLLTTFTQFSLTPPPASGNHKSDLFDFILKMYSITLDI